MDFLSERRIKALNNFQNGRLLESARNWHNVSRINDYQYMFEVFGLPIIQDPQDIVMLQEMIWNFKPDLVIETGVARGGSVVLSASILALFNYIESIKEIPVRNRCVIGIDIEVRQKTSKDLSDHPLKSLIKVLEGSSVDERILSQARSLIPEDHSVMVILDSDHSHDHVLAELNLYSDLVTANMPLIVMDTGIEFAEPSTLNPNRDWGKGNSPYSAVQSFLKSEKGQRFETFLDIEMRHLITCAPAGVLIKSRA